MQVKMPLCNDFSKNHTLLWEYLVRTPQTLNEDALGSTTRKRRRPTSVVGGLEEEGPKEKREEEQDRINSSL